MRRRRFPVGPSPTRRFAPAGSNRSASSLWGRSCDPVPKRQRREGGAPSARHHGQAEADSERREDTDLQGFGGGVRLLGLAFGRPRTPDPAWTRPVVGEGRDVSSESRMRQTCMSGSMSGVWKTGAMGDLVRPRQTKGAAADRVDLTPPASRSDSNDLRRSAPAVGTVLATAATGACT